MNELMDRDFNPVLIDEVAAWLFWLMVHSDGFSSTREKVLKSHGDVLLKSTEKSSVFSMHKINELSDDAINQFSEEVARYAYQKSLDERNMIGIVYQEDMEKGRTPSAESIDASAFNIPVVVSGDDLECHGKLCIRYPLPSVVITNRKPEPRYFRVEDTNCLGFDYPIYISPDSASDTGNEQWLVTGVFYIPENTRITGRRWREIIPNSICTTYGGIFYGNDSRIKLGFHWGGGKTGVIYTVKSLFKRLLKFN